jgi:hypothetical protein
VAYINTSGRPSRRESTGPRGMVRGILGISLMRPYKRIA